MTIKRQKEIYDEAMRRRDLWVKNEGYDAVTCGGSFVRFDMSLGLAGYLFEKKPWMDKNDFGVFVTDDEFWSDEYNSILLKIFRLV